MKPTRLTILFAVLLSSVAMSAKDYKVSSPDRTLTATVSAEQGRISWSITKNGTTVLSPSAISVTTIDGATSAKATSVWTGSKKAPKAIAGSVRTTQSSQLYKKSTIRDEYDCLTLRYPAFDLEVRVYDEGAAYRFVSRGKNDFKVQAEQAEFTFPCDAQITLSYTKQHVGSLESQLFNSFENDYSISKISEMKDDFFAFLPVHLDVAGYSVNISESGLTHYPGMFIYNASYSGDESFPIEPSATPNTIRGTFAAVPDEIEQGGHNLLQGIVRSRKPYIAECKAGEKLPWRIVAVASEEAQLLDSDIVWLLGEPTVGDYSWVKPGKVAWDWWNNWNLYDVDFKAGINNETYKYYIDFAASKGIEYVILDEGWAVNKKADLFQVIPEIDLKELVDYGAQKNVGIILWAGYWAFDRDMERVCKTYSEMGVKGFKIDFLDRDDQPMVEFTARAAETCAKYRMIADFHGMFKPAGLNRTWPNVVNFEGVNGLEQMKWSKMSDFDQVTYDTQIPFIRMWAGPMDYTQGAMKNTQKHYFQPNNDEPGSQGTRCHQMAMYTVFEAPFTMLCDSPSNYMREPVCTDFIAAVPTVWDETKAVGGKMGEWCAIARRSGDTWYVGVLNNWTERDVVLDLGFIAGKNVTVLRDGINSKKSSRDFKKEDLTIPADGKLSVHLACGGGWTCHTIE